MAAIFNGVLDEVEENLLEGIGVGADLEVGRDLVFEAGLSFARQGTEEVASVLRLFRLFLWLAFAPESF